jgi:two-component system, cell cycle sensor histidine kinase and response regulator CckA
MRAESLLDEGEMSEAIWPNAGDGPFDLSHLSRYFSEQSPQPMLAVEGPTHLVRYLNPAFATLVGKSVAELIGRPFAEAVPEGAANGCSTLLDRVLQTGRPEQLVEQEHRQEPPSYWSYSLWPILGPTARPAGVMIQVTEATAIAAFRQQAVAINEALVVSSVRQHAMIDTIQRGEQHRRELENQIFQAQKLESLGLLAGGIAHDLNNLLTPVLGYALLAAEYLPEDSPAVPMLEVVASSTKRAADLVQQILAFAGKGRFVVEPVEFSELIREMDVVLKGVISAQGSLQYELAADLPCVEGDVTQLRQVVVNLVTNAFESLAENVGTVTVRTGLAPKTSSELSVFLEVEDTGCGMTAEKIEKIFDPFFTTKFTGRGLGLAVVQGIARGHRGSLQVRSTPGGGSTVRLTLPASTRTPARPEAIPQAENRRGARTILVIDDEQNIREFAKRVLESSGLTVLLAADGLDGLKVFEKHQDEIGAVFVDLTMPRMGGFETSQELQKLRPGLPVVLISGYSIKEAIRNSEGQGIIGCVQKPFHAADLLSAVRQALGDTATRP